MANTISREHECGGCQKSHAQGAKCYCECHLTPTFCPFCGKQGTLKDCSGAGFVEKGCYNGNTYCYEGDLPGKECTACGGSFSLDVSDDDVHSSCECGPNADWCECERHEQEGE